MANNRTPVHPIPADFAAILHSNFQQLNCLPPFDIDFLDKDKDWYLLCFLREQQRNGHSFEVTFAALSSIVGALSEQSYFYDTFNKNIVFLNQNHHLLGESASNKSSICHEISSALQCVIESFPNRYSSPKTVSNNENYENYDNIHKNKNKNKSYAQEYSLMVSNITEVGLINNLSKINTTLLHSDGDVALNKFGYYDQGRNETAAGVSLFCDASDGIRGGFIRATGISQIIINRPVALLNIFIASTGTKMANMLQRFYELRIQDGIFGRVFFTWCPSISELPMAKPKCYTNVASFSHFANSVAHLFINEFQFRYSAHESDFMNINTEHLEDEERLMQEREKQNVTTPATYGVTLNNNDIRTCDIDGDQDDNDEQTSSFKLLKTFAADWWKSSNSAEDHLKSIRRKVNSMLPKCIWSMKVIRIIFRLMSNNLRYIDQKQGDRSTSNSASIDLSFQQAMETSIKNYLLTECHKIRESKWIIWSNKNDIIVGYNWYLRKMLVVEALLTLKSLRDIVAQRIGTKPIEKNPEEIKLEKAMIKVMNFSVVFFTRQYLTNNKQGAGSGQFSHSYNLKPDQILSPLIENGLLIGGNFIKNGRHRKDNSQYSSYCKQLPSVIQNNPRIKQAFESLGLNMSHYETTFEHQRLPLGMEFTNEAIDFMKNNDGFVQYYHNYYKEDHHFQLFREMVNERILLGEIIRNEGKLHPTDSILINNHQKENIHNKTIFKLNNTPSNSTLVTTHITGTPHRIQTTSEITSESLTGNKLLYTTSN
ncbi:unnamed protein product [Rotaria sp. Silwood1]|nr:unnamed protein product [Rotaria sp. Silwood1]CAF4987499.1 unnamed protein product [Rotaria sp. Silwood1]CAF5083558.1 unnamed protein product [Rotaria sp. Silwood1]